MENIATSFSKVENHPINPHFTLQETIQCNIHQMNNS